MKNYLLVSLLTLVACGQPGQSKKQVLNPQTEDVPVASVEQSIYRIIIKNDSVPGTIHTADIDKLDEPLRAVAAFYAAMGGTSCDGQNCQLTTALGLGKQGSDAHKKLILSYFPGDKVAETVVGQNCYLRPSGASTFSDYQYLTIDRKGNNVSVDYGLMIYNQGSTTITSGPDEYVLTAKGYKKTFRNLWKHVDQ